VDIELNYASIDDKSVLRNLMELCQHDYSEYDGADVDEHGLFGYRYLDHYWTEAGRTAFLVIVAGKLAGFALVRTIEAQDKRLTHTVAELFVMRKYRRQGIGRQVAWRLFDLFPGHWSIAQEEGNRPAQSFWRQVIAEYTQGAYTDEVLETEEWHGPRQRFQSGATAR
jgi:predicted acetyltransferase